MPTERPNESEIGTNSEETEASEEASPPSASNGEPLTIAASPSIANPLSPPKLSPRSVSDPPATAKMTASSALLGNINAARRPQNAPLISSNRGVSALTEDIQKKMREFHMGRMNAPKPGTSTPSSLLGSPITSNTPPSPSTGQAAGPGGVPATFKLPNGKPVIAHFQSAPAVPSLSVGAKKPSLAEKRGMPLPGCLPAQQPQANGPPGPGVRKKPGLRLSQIGGGANPDNSQQPPDETKPTGGTMIDKYAEYLDASTGTLKFKGKATLSSQGVEFAGGSSFSISLDEVDTLDELGKGNYGTVFKVRHSRPKFRRAGFGLAGNKLKLVEEPRSPPHGSANASQEPSPTSAAASAGYTGMVMAMKEIRLELEESKFAAIIMELDILHRCISPYIVDFFGAFFQEGAVYICMEFMDGGSIDKLYGDGIPENVLRKITYSTTMGLKSLKDDHNIIHRDVKPTNILVNTRGQIKICDFGVSGNLVASFAKTNIGCQSYMAPERISGGGIAMAGANPGGGTYSVQSDIWSLGLTIIECAMGRYPYPPETYSNIFSQLSVGLTRRQIVLRPIRLTRIQAIVDGDPPDLPKQGFSGAARDFVRGCLNKIANLRPTYAMLLQHTWLAPLSKPTTITEEDEEAISTPVSELGNWSDTEAISSVPEKCEGDINKSLKLPDDVVDREVSEWVLQALEKRRLGKLAKAEKPALHAAPLDAVSSPIAERASYRLQLPTDSAVSDTPATEATLDR